MNLKEAKKLYFAYDRSSFGMTRECVLDQYRETKAPPEVALKANANTTATLVFLMVRGSVAQGMGAMNCAPTTSYAVRRVVWARFIAPSLLQPRTSLR